MQNIIIQISDPWDLGESIKWEPLNGNIVSFSKTEDKVLIRLKNSFHIKNSIFNYVVFSSRYDTTKTLNVLEGNEIFGGGVGISDSQANSNNPYLDTWRGGGLSFIGSIKTTND